VTSQIQKNKQQDLLNLSLELADICLYKAERGAKMMLKTSIYVRMDEILGLNTGFLKLLDESWKIF